MKTKTIPASWIQRDGHRLDSGPYMSGAFEAKIHLEKLSVPKEPLHALTSGHDGGIFNGPQFSRRWVNDPEYGVPFVGSSSMLRADLSHLPLLRKKDAYSNKLSFLRLEQGMTLISCSGTIGRMVYVRPDMAGMWSSQDIIKVVPNPQKILPGYLYAYLSSKFGVPLVVGGTYGAIIQHIEPHHIAELPVPRLGDEVELEAHKLVANAATNRSQAIELLRDAQNIFSDLLGFRDVQQQSSDLWTSISTSRLKNRLDAYYYSDRCLTARRVFDAAKCKNKPLESVAEVFIPGIFKRRYVDDPQFGYPYITWTDVFQIAASSDRLLMKQVTKEYELLVKKGMILIQEAGQLDGLIGRSVAVGNQLDGFAVSNNMVRVTAKEEGDIGYLYTVLSSSPGVTLISREAAGSSIPHLEIGRVRQIEIPWAENTMRQTIGGFVIEARDLRDQACELESQAVTLVEQTIEELA
jgi:type I restriction enzyme S subunit